MPILLDGIRVTKLTIDTSNGENSLDGAYELVASNGKVLATQEFGGYRSTKIALTPEAKVLLDNFVEKFKNDMNKLLGFE